MHTTNIEIEGTIFKQISGTLICKCKEIPFIYGIDNNNIQNFIPPKCKKCKETMRVISNG
jgi:hypothetical protein